MEKNGGAAWLVYLSPINFYIMLCKIGYFIIMKAAFLLQGKFKPTEDRFIERIPEMPTTGDKELENCPIQSFNPRQETMCLFKLKVNLISRWI